jgi:hypothetical protein
MIHAPKRLNIEPLGDTTMQTIQMTAHVDDKGMLQIQLPDYPGEELEILLVYQPIPKTQKRQWSQRFLRTFGAWQGEPLEREHQGEQPKRDELV